jgi:hypothetical protein
MMGRIDRARADQRSNPTARHLDICGASADIFLALAVADNPGVRSIDVGTFARDARCLAEDALTKARSTRRSRSAEREDPQRRLKASRIK